MGLLDKFMEDKKVIEIKCTGSTTVTIDELHDLQGEDFKTLSENDYVKLRNSIVEFGFSFPLFFWNDSENKKWAIDGHQRNFRVLPKMREEGYEIPPLPACEIFAKDKKEAKKKLLLLNSRYGQITDTGMTDFINEDGSDFDIEDVEDFITLPEISFDEEDATDYSGGGSKKEKEVECPSCKTKFTI